MRDRHATGCVILAAHPFTFNSQLRSKRRRRPVTVGTKLYVGNLNYNTNEASLREAFGADGREVASVSVARQAVAVATVEAAVHPALDHVQVVSVRPLVASIVLPVAVDTVRVAAVRAVVAARAIAIVKARPMIARRSDATTTTAIRPFVA